MSRQMARTWYFLKVEKAWGATIPCSCAGWTEVQQYVWAAESFPLSRPTESGWLRLILLLRHRLNFCPPALGNPGSSPTILWSTLGSTGFHPDTALYSSLPRQITVRART